MSPKDIRAVVNYIFEVGILERTPRSGLWFLGTGEQSVAEHLFRTTIIGYMLAKLTPKAKAERVIFLCLVHDLGEARTSDLNYAHQRYGRLAEAEAVADISQNLPFGKEILDAYTEEQGRKTLEAKLAKDADQLEWIATIRNESIKGNTKARAWAKIAEKRLETSLAKKIAKQLLKTHPDDWWLDLKDKWFVGRDPKFKSWKK